MNNADRPIANREVPYKRRKWLFPPDLTQGGRQSEARKRWRKGNWQSKTIRASIFDRKAGR